MNVIAVRLARNEMLEDGSELHQMRETLFSSKMTAQEKEEKLEKEFGMRMKEMVKKGADFMFSYSDLVEEHATKRGLEKGMKQGLEQGLQQGETRFGELVTVLLKEGHTDLIELVATDEQARAEYYEKYGIN